MTDDVLDTMREYAEYAELKSEKLAFEKVIEEVTRLRAENEKQQKLLDFIDKESVELRAENEKLREELDEQSRLNGMGGEREAKLASDNRRLRIALKPFADMAGYYDVEADDQPAWDNDFQPTVGELRAAAAAIREVERE